MMESESRGEVLSRDELHYRITTSHQDAKKLVVTPIIEIEQQVGESSVDLRLGNEFILAKRTRYPIFDPLEALPKEKRIIEEYQEKAYVELGDRLVLHPQQLALGGTLEYIKLPNDLVGYITGRSSWGRAGLIIATATVIQPKYSGIITLELVNSGDAPIALYPGVRICQLVLHRRREPTVDLHQSLGKYDLSTSPAFSEISSDREWKAIDLIKKENHPTEKERKMESG